MKQFSFSVTIFIAIVSVFLFSGQQRRPVVPTPQQRQPAPPIQRQTTPPKPTTTPTKPPQQSTPTPATAMPHLFWLPEEIKYEGSSRTARLLGDSQAEGIYVTRTFIPKGTQGVLHTHPDSRTVVVVSGTCYYGLVDELGESRITALPPGSFLTEPAGVPHFTWAKDGDVIIQTTGIGPSGTQIIPDKKPVGQGMGGIQGRP